MKVLISDPITDSGLKLLKDANLTVDYLPEWTDEELKSHVSDVHGWIVRSGTKVTEALIDKSKNLQII